MPKRLSLLYATFAKKITKIYTISMSSVAKKLRKNQQGFSAWIIVLFLMLILVLLLVFWYVRQQDSKNQQAKTSSSNNSKNALVQTSPEKTSQNTVKYLEIKEYGVKLVLTKDIEDAYYVIENGYPYLSVKSLEKYPYCNLSQNKSSGSIAAVARAKVGDDNYGSPWTQAELEKASKLKVGEYYYWIDLANGAACSDTTGQNPDPADTAARKAFSAAKIEKL